MNAAWNQPQPAPQLEQEYSLEPHLLDLSQTANPTSNHFYQHIHPGRSNVHNQGSSHVSNFPNYGHGATGGSQSSFNFGGSPPNQAAGPSQQPFDNTYFPSSVNGPALQAQNAFSGQISQYGGSPSPSMVHSQAQYQTTPPGGYPPEASFENPGFVPSVPSQIGSQRFSPNPLAGDMLQQMQPRYQANESVNDGDGNDDSRPEPLRKPMGACARCKGLKVRCEFKTDPDTCKRCLNAGAECVIPGRKKRRAPPKREVLLKQIQSQAEQIKSLIGQLDEANRKADNVNTLISNAPSPATTTTDLYSNPSLSESETSGSQLSLPPDVDKPDVMDWIQKARESFDQFGGYISAGQGLFGRGDDDYDEEEEIAINIEDADDDDDDDDNGTLMDEGEVDYSFYGDEGSAAGGSRRHARMASDPARVAVTTTAAPFPLMAKLALETRKRRPSAGASDMGDDEPQDGESRTNHNYFALTATPVRPRVDDHHEPPHIVKKRIVSPAEVESLFKIYWDYMNISLNILDPELYTPQKTYWRSPFLFTVICAVASRFYTPRPDLYPQAMHFARLAAGTALIGGRKNVEMVQAYLILAMNPVPCRRWEDDRSWVFLGLAIRIATAINLHLPLNQKPKNEQHAREMLNRTRTWLTCFNLDRSFGSQYGKPPIISNTDYTANHCAEWWSSSEYNLPAFDIHIACYSNEVRVMADFSLKIRSDRNNPTGFNRALDIPKLATETDDEMIQLWEKWSDLLKKETDLSERKCNFRRGLLRLAFTYGRLTALSLGFQFGRKNSGDTVMLLRCLRVAKEVASTYVDDIGIPEQRIYMRHGPDSQSVFVTFACTFLIKLLQPKYAPYLTAQERAEVRQLVGRVADLMGSPEVAVDDRHYPKLYSRFLKGLLDTPMAKYDPPKQQTQPNVKAQSESPTIRYGELRESSASSTRGSVSNPSSARPSASPPPADQQHLPIDHFSQQLAAGLDPYSSALFQGHDSMNVPEYFNPPLPFEPEMIQSMQSLTDPSVYQDVMSGFSWMGDMHQNDNDINMHYDPRNYGTV
ncbi:hypothetical protein QCA50_006026 [Cerrena zonata]|uniref:Zn(2)-C6 fungal-type domain-containing protein n=1 Tax=Cerrena zonata TaxID=2478898 RepID=A0AAW0GBJ7_9APHY